VLWVSPLFAHHSFSSEYHITAQVELKVKSRPVEWANPHVFVTIAVHGGEGIVQEWRVEGGAVSF